MSKAINPFEVFFAKWTQVVELFGEDQAAEIAQAAIGASVGAMDDIKTKSPCECGNPMCDLRWKKLMGALAMQLAACNDISEVLQMVDDDDFNEDMNRRIRSFLEIVIDRENWPKKTEAMIQDLVNQTHASILGELSQR